MHSAKSVLSITVALLLIMIVVPSIVVPAAAVKFDIERYGKNIQLDGAISEWPETDIKPWENSGKWVWDAMNTPAGLAGYVRANGAIQCSSWVFTIDSRATARPIRLSWPADPSTALLYRAQKNTVNGANSLTIEWVIPWDSLTVDTTGTYAIAINGSNGCGDSLQPLLLMGSKLKPPTVFTRGVVTQMVLVSILLLVYFVVRTFTGRQTRRKGSLRL